MVARPAFVLFFSSLCVCVLVHACVFGVGKRGWEARARRARARLLTGEDLEQGALMREQPCPCRIFFHFLLAFARRSGLCWRVFIF